VLSRGQTQNLKAGDRLPWVAPPSRDTPDNFTPLESLDWQIHIYGECAHDVKAFCEQRDLPLHTFEWSKQAATAGLTENALYLVRSDGYIGLAAPDASIGAIDEYLALLR